MDCSGGTEPVDVPPTFFVQGKETKKQEEGSLSADEDASVQVRGDEEPDGQLGAAVALELPPGWEFEVFEGDFDQGPSRKRRSHRLPPGISTSMF